MRIAFYGDSNHSRDFMGGAMRRILQKKYGDAGHGYLGLGRPWAWYDHMDVRIDRQASEWFTYNVTSQQLPGDAHYGHGMITVMSLGEGARTWVATADKDAPVGRTATRFDVHFLRGPQLGSFDMIVDGEVKRTVHTRAKEYAAGFAEVELPDAPHKLVLKVGKEGLVRLMGVAVERDPPGIVLDNIGVGMLGAHTMIRTNEQTFRQTIRHRGYDLVMFQLGTMKSPWLFEPNMRKVIARHKAALPGVPLLLMTPPDRVDYVELKKAPPSLNAVCGIIEQMAQELGLAFFDFRKAEGGEGSELRLAKAHMMGDGDNVHMNPKGAKYMGERVVYAIMSGFAAWLASHETAGCEGDAKDDSTLSARSVDGKDHSL